MSSMSTYQSVHMSPVMLPLTTMPQSCLLVTLNTGLPLKPSTSLNSGLLNFPIIRRSVTSPTLGVLSWALELAAGLAVALKDKTAFDDAMQRLTQAPHSKTGTALLQARAAKSGLIPQAASDIVAAGETVSTSAQIPVDHDDDGEDTGLAAPVPPELQPFVDQLNQTGDALSFAERIQAAVYLEHHGACCPTSAPVRQS